jgi:hypothetical protein
LLIFILKLISSSSEREKKFKNTKRSYSQIKRSSIYFIIKIIAMSYYENQQCIQACLECAAACNHCATECTKEEDVQMMARCIQLDMACAVACNAAGQLITFENSAAAEMCALCARICDECAEECARHEHMDHCKRCAVICRHCAGECRKMAAKELSFI